LGSVLSADDFLTQLTLFRLVTICTYGHARKRAISWRTNGDAFEDCRAERAARVAAISEAMRRVGEGMQGNAKKRQTCISTVNGEQVYTTCN
jgi:hypothetical protein